jgi:hypothetical protein
MTAMTPLGIVREQLSCLETSRLSGDRGIIHGTV